MPHLPSRATFAKYCRRQGQRRHPPFLLALLLAIPAPAVTWPSSVAAPVSELQRQRRPSPAHYQREGHPARHIGDVHPGNPC